MFISTMGYFGKGKGQKAVLLEKGVWGEGGEIYVQELQQAVILPE